MAEGQSPPGRPGFTIQPLKPDKEVPGGGRQFWLTRHDSKHPFKHKIKCISDILSIEYTFPLNMHYIEQSFIM